MHTLFRRFAACLALLLIAGCGEQQADYSKVDLVNVTGTVTYEGIPLGGAVVMFEDPETGSFAYGLTDDTGHYELQIDSEMKGVTLGEKIVRISTAKKILGLNTDDEGGEEGDGEETDRDGGAVDQNKEILPDRYHTDSVLRATVTATETTFDFDLELEPAAGEAADAEAETQAE